MQIKPRYVTTKEAGALLGYGIDKVRRMCEAGMFEHAFTTGKQGAHWRIPISDVEAMIAARKPMKRVKR
jgi:excisionase family DNA binding protein